MFLSIAQFVFFQELQFMKETEKEFILPSITTAS